MDADAQVPSDGPVVAVVGATAAGKTALSLRLCHLLGGEVVNTDSMQQYRGMDIGTAKLPPAEREGVPHHLVDVLDVTQPATVAEFQHRARAVIADCHARGAVPVLVGGSALYTRAVVDRFEFPGTDPQVRARLERDLADTGAEALHARLADVDPSAAAAILPSNHRRVVRALEVVEITGRPFSATLPRHEHAYDHVVMVGVDIGRELLVERIERRVDAMWRAGLVDEVRDLERRGLREGRTASAALGYAQVLDHLAGGSSSDEAREATVVGTRRFARRQDAWFRKDPRVRWVAYDDPHAAGTVAALARP